MKTISLGSVGIDVLFLQSYLELTLDGSFGPKTESVLKEFQRISDLKVDGVCGPKTWNYLNVAFPKTKITNDYLSNISDKYGISIPLIKTVWDVETNGKNPFLESGLPVILFEGHIFWKQLLSHGIDPLKYQNGNEDILFKKWDKTKYKGGEKEWDRLERASQIDFDSALESASLGMFQIMGFNWKSTGSTSVRDYYSKSFSGELEQLEIFCQYLERSGLISLLIEKNFKEFAKRYNGSGQIEYYSKKLEESYNKYK